MQKDKLFNYIENVLKNIPADWIELTTHRLDIYNESLAKTEFIDEFEALYRTNNSSKSALTNLPTAYDYIRLGHPLSSVLEWAIAKLHDFQAKQVISFSSQTMSVLAILRKNLFSKKNTQILYTDELPSMFDFKALQCIYGYDFEIKQIENEKDIPAFEGSTIFISQKKVIGHAHLNPAIDFYVTLHPNLGSIVLIDTDENDSYISEIQHVRRRETIAMTPADSFSALQELIGANPSITNQLEVDQNRKMVVKSVQMITATESKVLFGSCGLSVQYAIMMGLINDAYQKYPDKRIKIIVPPNCYGGTNDQARRVVAATKNVDILDLPVDKDNDMVESTHQVLDQVAKEDAVPFIIAEIPTNPRVEVPNLEKLRAALSKIRKSPSGKTAVKPVFILDQTFCPNLQFLSKSGIFSSIQTISYVSGSKFPSGGRCTAGYCVANENGEKLMPFIEKHFQICDNGATPLQLEILAEQLPSMNQRIKEAYLNTRDFVEFIKKELPKAKINFVTDEVVEQGFTPSVFSLDLPTKGKTKDEKETYKRALNKKLIKMMITEIPNESKHCVSYGQLNGCYWTIPATSTQGTTKEKDKDYIARVSVSPKLDLERHKQVFTNFVNQI